MKRQCVWVIATLATATCFSAMAASSSVAYKVSDHGVATCSIDEAGTTCPPAASNFQVVSASYDSDKKVFQFVFQDSDGKPIQFPAFSKGTAQLESCVTQTETKGHYSPLTPILCVSFGYPTKVGAKNFKNTMVVTQTEGSKISMTYNETVMGLTADSKPQQKSGTVNITGIVFSPSN